MKRQRGRQQRDLVFRCFGEATNQGRARITATLSDSNGENARCGIENVRNKDHANRIHNDVGRKVRKTIHELGGTMPENLPVAA